MRVVIVGAGFAGVATAYHLARRGVKEILVLEREEGPGMHASGRNAGLLRQSSSDAPTAALLREGARVARRIATRIPGGIQESGSLILGDAVDRLEAGPRARVVDASSVVPGLEGRALFDPDDALIDPQTLLGVYLAKARRRGVEFAFLEGVESLRRRDGRVTGVITGVREIAADQVVIAAGAWSAEIAGGSITLESRRRHLFRGALGGARGGPFVWHESAGVYYRPEGDGMVMSPCDTEPHPAAAPEVDDRQRDVLAERLASTFGDLGEWRIGTGWACLRTFAPDERFLIGPDPDRAGLFWVAGLGGHGVTASWAVGRLAARVLIGRADPGLFDPRRFARRASR